MIGALLFVVSLVALVVAFTAEGSAWAAFSRTIREALPTVIVSSGLLAALIALAGQTFTSISTRQAPSTEEEFERLFKDLVLDIQKARDCSRIVIFIDELDRCSPEQVVTALETIRTFLDIPPCIFIVAADQQAVEQALKEEARQATPVDPANPYYGAGTAYLDKIFQYQLALPPLLPRTLSQFALNLIEKRPGVWQEIENKPELITVLVPEHVRSPRRVKVLLNAFVLSFRLAVRRASEGALDANVRSRASEIAKIVCLRTEFPLFDLRADSRMPQATLALYRDSSLTLADLGLMGFSEEAFARAEAYANGELPLYETIARRVRWSASADATDERSEEGDDGGVAAAEDVDGQPGELQDEESSDEDIDASLADPSDVIKSQARQLIAYLQRTEEIPGPARDLIYLESAGAALGLSPELADELERNALNGAVDAVVESIGQLDEPEQESAYRLLCHLVRERFGLEANNAKTCLLQAIRVAKGPLDSVVDDVLTTLRVATSGYSLRTADLAGAFELSLLRDSDSALELRKQVLARDETRTDETLGLLMLSRSQNLSAAERQLLGPILAERVVHTDVDSLFGALTDLEDAVVADLVTAHEEQIREGLDPEGSTERFGELASHAVSNRTGLAPPFLMLLLGLDSKEARDIAAPLLPQVEPITDRGLVRAVLVATGRRSLANWRRWLPPLDPKTVGTLEGGGELVGALAARILSSRFKPEQPASDEEAAIAIELLRQVTPDVVSIPSEPIEQAFHESAPGPAVNDDQVEAHRALHDLTESLAESSFLGEETAAHLVLNDIAGTIGQPIAATDMLHDYVLGGINLVLESVGSSDIEAILNAVTTSPWMAQERRNVIVLFSRSLQREEADDIDAPLASDELTSLVALGSEAEPALTAWLRSFKPSPEQVHEVFAAFSVAHELQPPLREGIRSLTAEWSEDARQEFFAKSANEYVAGQIGPTLLSAYGFENLDSSHVASELSRIFDEASNNPERGKVMEIWRLIEPSEAAQRTLVNRVYIPLLRQGRGAAKIALDFFDLVATPPSGAARDRIRAAIREEVKGDTALERRANDILRAAGWIKKRGLFRR